MKNKLFTISFRLSSMLLAVFLFSSCDVWVEDDGYEFGYSESEYSYYEEDYVYYEEESDPDDASGGLDYWSDSRKGNFRSQEGTYALNYSNNSCDDLGYNQPNLDLPSQLRLFSYDNQMDFETPGGNLAWAAEIYPNGDFDFETNFLDWNGYPSVIFPCACTLYSEWYADDSFECECAPSNTTDNCSFSYDLI